MSRASRERPRKAQSHWPALSSLMCRHFGERFWMQYDSFGAARKSAIAELDHSERKQVATEWWNWNASEGAFHDIRVPLASLGVEPPFETPRDARQFMNELYDAMIAAIREAAPGWKPK